MKIIPPFLKQGDKVSIVATAKNFAEEDLNKGLAIIESWGLEVAKGKNLLKKHFNFAGKDEERVADLQEAVNDRNVKVIFFARGGYGTGRIIDQIDFSALKESPKWLVGFSDITVAHFHIQNLGYASIHGPMPLTLFQNKAAEAGEKLKAALFGNLPEYKLKTHKTARQGEAEAEVIGGNLSIINNLIATPSDFDFSGKILFLEEVGEYLYHLDRMMVHLKRAGKLANLAGLVIGYFSDMKDNEIPFGKNVEEIILGAVKDYNYPVLFGFPAGHEQKNMPLLLGARAKLVVRKKDSALSYSL